MPGELNIGSVVGYLRLNRSQWTEEIDAAKQQARELGRENPRINIETNAPKALADLEAVAIASKRLQDAQGRQAVAQSKVNDLEEKGITSGTKYVKAQNDLSRATRDVELQQIRVAKAFDGSSDSLKKLGDAGGHASTSLWSLQVLGPLIGAAVVAIGPAAAVGAAGLAALGLGALGLKNEVIQGLSPAFHQLQDDVTGAMRDGLGDGLDQARQAIPKLSPLLQVFGREIGHVGDEIATWLNHGGIKTFTEYAETELPIVENLFKSLTVFAGQFFKDTQIPANDLINTTSQLIGDLTSILKLRDSFNLSIPGPSSADKGVKGFFGGLEDATLRGRPEGLLHSASIGGGLIEQGISKVPGAVSGFIGLFQNKKPKADIQDTTKAIDEIGQSSARMATDMQDAAANTMAAQNQVAALSKQAPNANVAMQGLLTSLEAYAGGAGRASDKAALLMSVLKASQGDALSYSAAVAGGYDAFHSLVITFQNDTKDTQLGVKAFRDTEKAAIDLKTGLIDLKATGAVPLVQQLQAMQDAAAQAAGATYQHEVAVQGQSKALQDAQTVFESMTRGTLVDNAKQLGLTKDQAQKLADQYFSFDGKTVTTTVQSIGLNDINSTLSQIGEQLSVLTGKPWVVDLTLSAKSLNNIKGLHGVVNDIPGHAAGGGVQDGWFTAGEAGWELGYKSGSNVQFYSNSQSKAMAPSQGPTVIQLTSYTQVDGRTIATTTNEYNLAAARR